MTSYDWVGLFSNPGQVAFLVASSYISGITFAAVMWMVSRVLFGSGAWRKGK